LRGLSEEPQAAGGCLEFDKEQQAMSFNFSSISRGPVGPTARTPDLVRAVMRVLTAGGATIAAVVAGHTASAQIAPAAASEGLETIVVTGSRISRTDAETPAPIQILTAEDLKESGFTTVSDVLRNLTANGQGTLSSSFPGAFAGGATGVSLRGLNTSATLVLIDGHRMAPYSLSDDGQRSFVDISSIPFDSVERVEVLKDGASAAYGSDAMAGVVNVILKRKYVGTTISAEAGTSTEGGGTTDHFAVMHGMGDLDSDGYNGYISLEYRHQNDILQSQRQGDGRWSSMDQTSIGGITQVPGVVEPFRPVPAAYGTVFLTPLTGSYSAANSYFYPNAIQPNAAYKGNCTYALQQTGGCAFISPFSEIQPETKNFNALASIKKKIGEDWLLDVKGSLFNSTGEQRSPSANTNGLVIYPTVFNPNIGVSAYSLPRAVGTTIAAVTVPANYPGNPFGAPAKVRGVNLDGGYLHTNFDSNSYRFASDLSGKVGGWTLDFSAGWSQEVTKQYDYGGTNTPELYALLNSATNPWLITGGNSAANVAAVFPGTSAIDTSTLMYTEADATRTLMTLAGGDLGLSAGVQYVTRKLNSPAPTLIAEGVLSGNNAFVLGTQTDAAAFAEIVAPVTKMLELDAHVRFDHFNISGNATTPSVGFKFTPVKAFSFRGTYGQGFRAPNPAENGNAGQAYSAGTSSDPILCKGGPAAAGSVISQCNFNLVYENSTNPQLKPEKSKSETLGIIFEPFRTWSSTLDFWQVKIDNQIVAGPPNDAGTVRGAPVVETCSDGHGGTYTCTTSVGEIVYVPVAYVNANSTKVNGLELTTKYLLEMGIAGNLTFDLDWSKTTSYQYTIQGQTFQLAGTHGPGVIGGNTGNPKDRVQANITYDKGPATFRTTLNYVGSFDLTDASGSNFGGPSALIANGIETADCAGGVQNGGYFAPWFTSGQPTNGKYCRVQGFLDVDMYGAVRLGDRWTLHLSVLNVFNQQPPLDLNTYGGGNLPYNPSMHQAGAVGRFINVGAKFEF
jgi:iron complex outermembrane receptor protein